MPYHWGMTYASPGQAVAVAAEIVGSQAALARSLNASAPTINQWAKGIRPIPEKMAVAIELITKGAVTRRDLRPDDWWQIWPEMAQSTPSHATPQEVSHG
jgi:DNA-binding transcriptional regulator YdaS (Cro superfamily)